MSGARQYHLLSTCYPLFLFSQLLSCNPSAYTAGQLFTMGSIYIALFLTHSLSLSALFGPAFFGVLAFPCFRSGVY